MKYILIVSTLLVSPLAVEARGSELNCVTQSGASVTGKFNGELTFSNLVITFPASKRIIPLSILDITIDAQELSMSAVDSNSPEERSAYRIEARRHGGSFYIGTLQERAGEVIDVPEGIACSITNSYNAKRGEY